MSLEQERREKRTIQIIQLNGDPREYTPDEGGEGISADVTINNLVFFLLNGVRDEIIKLASEPPAEDVQLYCSHTDESFQRSLSPVELIGHAIEHRTVILAVKSAIDEGHEVVASGETVEYPDGVAIKVQISSNKGSGFNLRDHLSYAINEVEVLLESSLDEIKKGD